MKRLASTIAAIVLGALLAQTAHAAREAGAQAPAPKRPSPTYPTPAPQKADSSVEQLLHDYQALFNKNDANALAALYAETALRLGLNNEVLHGRAEIEKFYVQSFAGTPGLLSVQPGRTEMITPDVAVLEGRYEVAGATGIYGLYIVTAVRQNGRWMLASVVPLPEKQ